MSTRDALRRAAERYDALMEVMLASLREAKSGIVAADAERVRRWIQSIPARRDDMGGTVPSGSGPSS